LQIPGDKNPLFKFGVLVSINRDRIYHIFRLTVGVVVVEGRGAGVRERGTFGENRTGGMKYRVFGIHRKKFKAKKWNHNSVKHMCKYSAN
jgi:hypothetical protein